MYTINKYKVLDLMEIISPQAKEYVNEGYNEKNVELLYSTEQENGVFLKVDKKDICIFYTTFKCDVSIEVINFIRRYLIDYTSKNNKEICFNIYGENYILIDLAKELGFRIDMIGYHMEFIGPLDNFQIDEPLTILGYNDNMLDEFVYLFDNAYELLNLENGWETNWCYKNKEKFNKYLKSRFSIDQLRSVWKDSKLIGVYITENNYITDVVVNPKYQGRGYGRYILFHCLKQMTDKNISNIRLRVTKSNKRAIKLYKLNKFKLISYFAEHTYIT